MEEGSRGLHGQCNCPSSLRVAIVEVPRTRPRKPVTLSEKCWQSRLRPKALFNQLGAQELPMTSPDATGDFHWHWFFYSPTSLQRVHLQRRRQCHGKAEGGIAPTIAYTWKSLKTSLFWCSSKVGDSSSLTFQGRKSNRFLIRKRVFFSSLEYLLLKDQKKLTESSQTACKEDAKNSKRGDS